MNVECEKWMKDGMIDRRRLWRMKVERLEWMKKKKKGLNELIFKGRNQRKKKDRNEKVKIRKNEGNKRRNDKKNKRQRQMRDAMNERRKGTNF